MKKILIYLLLFILIGGCSKLTKSATNEDANEDAIMENKVKIKVVSIVNTGYEQDNPIVCLSITNNGEMTAYNLYYRLYTVRKGVDQALVDEGYLSKHWNQPKDLAPNSNASIVSILNDYSSHDEYDNLRIEFKWDELSSNTSELTLNSYSKIL
jgi:uncharacterized protein YcfL